MSSATCAGISDNILVEMLSAYRGGEVEISNLQCGESIERGLIRSISVSSGEIRFDLSRRAIKECDGSWRAESLQTLVARQGLFKIAHSNLDASACLFSVRLGVTIMLYRKGENPLDWLLVKPARIELGAAHEANNGRHLSEHSTSAINSESEPRARSLQGCGRNMRVWAAQR